jgi:hypothetical protein
LASRAAVFSLREATLPGDRTLQRHPNRRALEPVAETDAWEDDQGNAHYILHCEQIGDPTGPRA